MKRVPQGTMVVAECACIPELYTEIKTKLVDFMCILSQVFKSKNLAPRNANKLQRKEAARRRLESHQIKNKLAIIHRKELKCA